jgi:hypothetical protein
MDGETIANSTDRKNQRFANGFLAIIHRQAFGETRIIENTESVFFREKSVFSSGILLDERFKPFFHYKFLKFTAKLFTVRLFIIYCLSV